MEPIGRCGQPVRDFPIAILQEVNGVRDVAVPLAPPMLTLEGDRGYRLTE